MKGLYPFNGSFFLNPYLHCCNIFLGYICMFCFYVLFLYICHFVLLCSSLFMCNNHNLFMGGLPPFKGSYFFPLYLLQFFLVVSACFMALLGLLQAIVFYCKHQRLVFLFNFSLFVTIFCILLCYYFSCSYL
jgi:hypothetical protein